MPVRNSKPHPFSVCLYSLLKERKFIHSSASYIKAFPRGPFPDHTWPMANINVWWCQIGFEFGPVGAGSEFTGNGSCLTGIRSTGNCEFTNLQLQLATIATIGSLTVTGTTCRDFYG